MDLSGVTISDAGSGLLISGRDKEAVEAALRELVVQGARLLSPPRQVGAKWLASCEKPGVSECIVEAVGLQLVITGTSRESVQAKLEALVANGARLVSPAVQTGDKWTAVCDRGGMDGVMILE